MALHCEAAAVRSITRRRILAGLAATAATLVWPHRPARGTVARQPVRFGLTPVFLSNDLELLGNLKEYLERASGHGIQFVTRRTYQEITAMLVSGQLDAAWICGYPFVQYRERLELVAVPVWRGELLYQSYLITHADRAENELSLLEDDLHAFSDPDSNSGYLVTRALLAERGETPDSFFRRTIFTYGHRNVVRAVAARLVDSGSVDGYVYEVLREVEPDLTGKTRIMSRSEKLGFPPIACPRGAGTSAPIERLKTALADMADDRKGLAVLNMLRLDGFAQASAELFDDIARKVETVKRLG
jgi:phosphonate transport system substrate-binding protein